MHDEETLHGLAVLYLAEIITPCIGYNINGIMRVERDQIETATNTINVLL
jgi:hypothetical protein